MILAADHIVVRYDAAMPPAVNDVTLAVHPHELVAVAGPNGCGKTSLLRALIGGVRPAAGTVTLDGRPLTTWSRREIAQVVGVLPQREEPAFPMKVRDAILLGRWAHLGAFAAPGVRDVAAIDSAIERCDVGALLDRAIDTLSGGEWQRVRLARTLASMPKLLMLDEPTAALDVGHEMAMFELLATLVADGLGVMVITHHLNVAARFASRIVLMRHGAAIVDGSPATAMEARTLSGLFEWPVEVHRLDDGTPQFVPRRDVPVRGGNIDGISPLP